MGDESSNEQCVNGSHFIYDGTTHSFVNAGPCHEVHAQAEESEPDPKEQVVQAAHKAMQAAQGQPQSGFDMTDTVFKR